MIEYVKLFISRTSKAIMGIALFCIVAIVAPASFLNNINLMSIRNNNIHWLWLALSASICLLASRALFGFFPVFKGRLNGWVIVYRGRKRLKALSKEEKKILLYYFDNDSRSQTLSLMNGHVTGLVDETILYRATEITEEADIYDFNILPWALKYLKEHPELLK